jgi:hypothetical protein
MCVLAYVASYHYAASRGPRSLSMSLARPFPSRSSAPVLLAAAVSLITLGLAFVRFCPHNIPLDAGSPSSRLPASDGPVRSVPHGEPRANTLRYTPMTAFLRLLDPCLPSSRPVALCFGCMYLGWRPPSLGYASAPSLPSPPLWLPAGIRATLSRGHNKKEETVPVYDRGAILT